jgi:hypothetical protein
MRLPNSSRKLGIRIAHVFLMTVALGVMPRSWAEPLPWTATTKVGIGESEEDKHSHLSFPGLPKDLIAVQATVTVDHAPSVGLNFFAIQVNFPNNTWAHGGPQFNDGKKKLANWGGLVQRGGGSADYKLADPAADLYLIESDPKGENTKPFEWAQKQPLKIEIRRGEQVTLPAGDRKAGGKVIHLDKPRTMWEWNLTISPVQGSGRVYRAKIHVAADQFTSFYLWNESGYGSQNKGQHATWSDVSYESLSAPGKMVSPTQYSKF